MVNRSPAFCAYYRFLEPPSGGRSRVQPPVGTG